MLRKTPKHACVVQMALFLKCLPFYCSCQSLAQRTVVHTCILLLFYLLFLFIFIFNLSLSSTVEPGSCTHKGKIYQDKSLWRPEKCVLCLCDYGTTQCDTIVCSDVSDCPNAVVSPGECCAVCPGSGMSYSLSPSCLHYHPILIVHFLLTARTVIHIFSYILVVIYYQSILHKTIHHLLTVLKFTFSYISVSIILIRLFKKI